MNAISIITLHFLQIVYLWSFWIALFAISYQFDFFCTLPLFFGSATLKIDWIKVYSTIIKKREGKPNCEASQKLLFQQEQDLQNFFFIDNYISSCLPPLKIVANLRRWRVWTQGPPFDIFGSFHQTVVPSWLPRRKFSCSKGRRRWQWQIQRTKSWKNRSLPKSRAENLLNNQDVEQSDKVRF